MNLPEAFTKKIFEDPDLTANFTLKHHKDLTNNDDFEQYIIKSDYKTMVKYLKLKLILILEENSNFCKLKIENIFNKIPRNDLKQLHSVLMYALLIEADLVDCVNRLLEASVQHLKINDNESKNNTLYNLEIIDTVLEVCLLRQLEIVKPYDENHILFNLIIYYLVSNEDRDIQKKLLIDLIPKYIKCTCTNELCLEIWRKINGSLSETWIIICLEKFYFPNIFLNQFNILNEIDFWNSLQRHIADSDHPAIQKEAMYLLKKSIHTLLDSKYLENNPTSKLQILNWETNHLDAYRLAWEHFFTLCDVSNEKQLHLIEPTFKLRDTLKNTLHISWQNCISKLFINHSHSAVVNYTIKKILKSEWSCNVDDLVIGLNSVFLYATENESIKNLLENYIQNLSEISLNDFLNKICIAQPSPVPFYFICKSIEVFKFENVHYTVIFDLLSSCAKVPHLYIRKGMQHSIFEIFLNMHQNVTYINDNLQDDFIKIVYEFYVNGYLNYKNIVRMRQLKILIETKFQILEYKLDEKLLLSPKYVAVFIGFLMDQRIINETWMQLNIHKFWSIIKNTKCCDSKLKYILFLFYIENIKLEFCTFYEICFTDDDIMNLLSELLIICKSSDSNHYTINFFNSILLIFDVLIRRKRDDPKFCKSCIHFLEELRNEQKNTCFIILLEKIIITIKGENVMYLSTIKMYLKEMKSNYEIELKATPNENIIKTKILTNYYYAQLNLTNLLFAIQENRNIFKKINKYYYRGGNEIILLVIDTLTTVITHTNPNIIDGHFCTELTNLLKRLETDIFHLRTNEIFRPAMTKFIKFLMNSNMPNNYHVKSFINNFCLKIFNPNQRISGLRNKILESSATELNSDILVEALLYCPILRKDQKIEFDACTLISKDFEMKNMHCNEENSYEIDIRVTSLGVSTLLHMLAKQKISCNTILIILKQKYEQCTEKRYYGDSQIHVTKLRIMQSLHLLVDYLNESDIKELNNWMYNCLVKESQQPSIKILIQWMLIRTYNKMGNLPKVIDDLIANSKDLTGTSITLLFPIFYHLLRDNNIDKNVHVQCFDFLLPFTMGPQFNIRYMAQLSLINIYESITDIDVKSRYVAMYKACIDAIDHTITDKDIDNILTFENLLPTIKTIYYEIPRLTNVSHTKFIPVEYFNDLPSIMGNIELKSDDSLKCLKRKSPKKKIQYSCASLSLHADTINMNVQKKIDTISINSFIEDTNIMLQTGNLIVVASLIDRAPNLGGLSRTCEVFGVKQYVLNNVHSMKTKEYQSLSMSSEKWVNTIQVKIEDLSNYLQEMKEEGYKVVGAEQTADSKKLDKYQFDEKTVLLLGNEKEGIPANLICLLDECIEIPQFGQIRSLNVHVAGALLIWEYAKQYS